MTLYQFDTATALDAAIARASNAARADDLTSLALSTSMAGWFRRGHRRDLLAAAQVYATLATVTQPEEQQP